MPRAAAMSASNRAAVHSEVIDAFHKLYCTAIAEAETQRITTDTEGWQSLYGERHAQDAKGRKDLANELREMADQLERHGLGEEDEKRLGKIKTSVADLRAVQDAFEETTIRPVRHCVEVCQKIVADALHRATRTQEDSPLTAAGLVDAMKAGISETMKVEWDQKKGRVVIGIR